MSIEEKCRKLAEFIALSWPHYDEILSKGFDPFTNPVDWMAVMKKVAEQDVPFAKRWIMICDQLYDAWCWPIRLLSMIQEDKLFSVTMNAAGQAAGLWEAENE